MRATVLLASAVLVAPVCAQDMMMPQPSEQLDAFAPALGHWKGSGTVVMEPGGQEGAWTSIGTTKRILNGFFIQDDMRVDTPMGALGFRTIYGVDPATEQLKSYGVGSMGSGESTVRWIDDMVQVAVGTSIENGVPIVDRWTVTYAKDSYSMIGERAIGDGPFFEHIVGEMRRVEEGWDASSPMEASAMAPIPDEAKKLAKFLGSYELAGSMNMPGMGSMEISGVEDADWMFGGAVLGSHVKGQPMNYEGHSYTYWDAMRRAYVSLNLSSMGEIALVEGHWADDKMVFMGMGMEFTGFGASRVVVSFGEHGVAGVAVHRMPSTGDAYLAFEATYTRRGGEASEAGSTGEPVMKFSPGSCCDKAAKKGGSCTHPCCAKAIEAGEVCTKCNK